ncbi:MAG: hypothetical protein ABI144_07575 [Gallionella sp.]
MKLPNNLPVVQLIKVLEQFGYQSILQYGSHARPANQLSKEHHLAIPIHDSLHINTHPAMPAGVATQRGIMRNELPVRLFRK